MTQDIPVTKPVYCYFALRGLDVRWCSKLADEIGIGTLKVSEISSIDCRLYS